MSSSYEPSKFQFLNDPPVTSRPFSVVVDGEKCIGCGVCIKQCPCQTVEMVPRKEPAASQQPACQFRCPAGTDIRGYLKVIADGGSLEDAWRIIVKTNPMPAVTGRVCPHPCESSCNRAGVDSAVNIHSLERSVGDYALERSLAFDKPAQTRKEKVAVVGSGPSGMSCAYQLAMMGYQVTVFEASGKAGGMLSWAIPLYRLPQAVVDAELDRIIALGITMRYNTTVGKDVSLDDLKKEFKAVYIALGAQASAALGVKGEDGDSVRTGLAFLRSVKENKPLALGKKVIVVGGGNTAIDAARTARRMGSEVTVLYRRTAAEMPAHAEEVAAAQEEGVAIEFLCAPVKIPANGKGKLTCQRMELGTPDESGRPRPVPVKGSEFELGYDTLIAAVGQSMKSEGFEPLLGSSWIGIDALGRTGQKGIFSGGDAASGPGLVSEAIGAGRKAAMAIDASFDGRKAELPVYKEISYRDVPLTDRKKAERNEAGGLAVEERMRRADAEVNLALDAGKASSEAKRCLGCGLEEPKFTGLPYFGKICIACHNCEAVCPQGALAFPHFYQVEKGRFAYDFDFPQKGYGYPNPLMLDKPAPLSDIEDRLTGTEKVIYNRRSTRVYKPDAVPKEIINRVLEAGRFAPSAGNCQGWKFVVLTDKTLMAQMSTSVLKFLNMFTKLYQGKGPMRTAIKKTLAFAKPSGCDQRPMVAMQALLTPKFGDKPLSVFFDAPCAILLLAHHMHISDASLGIGICAQNMVMAAHSLGLGTCYVGFVSTALKMDPATKKFWPKLGISWPYDIPCTVLTLGYPAVQVDKPVNREFPRIVWVE
ncbi:MAG TPA: FAD-dependent oxidoreductase [Deltaproteobacteria bacterium]|nr:FAD-dependent oxidoreductase [Deltaproteobacteria bacterium]HPR54013.1 FAD-dependent oxidoreductase [Deltaproteobacteria bacterium]HXK46364.1 FAD-dependent oxidoreductase [Deltaproteobacteria bacterium]